MGGRLSLFHGQNVIEQEDPLRRPRPKVTVRGRRPSTIPGHLLEDVPEGGRNRHTAGHGKGQPVSLSRPVIGVLTEDADPNLLRRAHLTQRREPVLGLRMAPG